MDNELELSFAKIELLIGKKDYPAATDLCDSLLKDYRTRADIWSKRAFVRKSAGDIVGAINDTERAVELAPREPCYRWNRGRYCIEAGDLDRAIESLTTALQLCEAAGDTYYSEVSYLLRAEAYSRVGRVDNALSDCNHVRDDMTMWIGKYRVAKTDILKRCREARL